MEWLVLAKEGNKVLVISKYALDCQPYNTSFTSVTWETCSLRKWLNGTFINNAFSAEEQAMIPTVTVSADKNPDYSTDPGNATQDKVFLLSITEANQYFTSDEARKCGTTEYAAGDKVLIQIVAFQQVAKLPAGGGCGRPAVISIVPPVSTLTAT